MTNIPVHDTPVWKRESWFGNGAYEYCHSFFYRLHDYLGMHENEFYELNIILEGSAQHHIAGTSYEASLGCIYFIPPGVSHGYSTQSGAVIYHALLRHDFFEKYEPELHNVSGYTLLFEVDPYLRNENQVSLPIKLDESSYRQISPTIEGILHYESNRHKDQEILKNTGMLYLLCQLSSCVSSLYPTARARENPNAIHIGQSMEFIRMNAGKHLTIEDLAKNACMSRSTYMRNFSQVAGCSPMQFLMRCRMAQARKLLCYSKLPVTNVALECGFYDTSHFVHAFLKYEGSTPSDYRTLYYHKANYSVCTICSR